jgi:hypothetical protein
MIHGFTKNNGAGRDLKSPPTLCDNLLAKSIIMYTCVSNKTIEDGLASGVQRPAPIFVFVV